MICHLRVTLKSFPNYITPSNMLQNKIYISAAWEITPCSFCVAFYSSVLFLSRPRSEGWPHHGCSFSIYVYPLSFWLTLPQGVLSMTWCCLSRPCVVFLACVHLALFLAVFLSPGNSLVLSRYDHSMYSFLALVVSNSSLFTPVLLRTHSFVFFAVHETRRVFLVLSSQRPQDVFLYSSWVSSFLSRTWLQATLALSLVVYSLKSVCCDFSIFLEWCPDCLPCI